MKYFLQILSVTALVFATDPPKICTPDAVGLFTKPTQIAITIDESTKFTQANFDKAITAINKNYASAVVYKPDIPPPCASLFYIRPTSMFAKLEIWDDCKQCNFNGTSSLCPGTYPSECSATTRCEKAFCNLKYSGKDDSNAIGRAADAMFNLVNSYRVSRACGEGDGFAECSQIFVLDRANLNFTEQQKYYLKPSFAKLYRAGGVRPIFLPVGTPASSDKEETTDTIIDFLVELSGGNADWVIATPTIADIGEKLKEAIVQVSPPKATTAAPTTEAGTGATTDAGTVVTTEAVAATT